MNSYDWVYIGKESYGSRHATRSSLKPGTKFFDVLGRAYDKMKARIKYYVFKDAVKRDVHETQLEFEVWARIIKDSEGNDIQVFIKEDKRNGLRKDSSFYYDGYWEVMEKDDVARTVKFRTSLGIKTLRLHDNQWRLTNKLITDKNNDTLVLEQYVWKNGRLVKMIENGMERIYTYGKTLQDIIKVTPSDEGLYFHPGYDNSVGMIPDENDPMYRFFALEPYGKIFGNENKHIDNNLLSKSNIAQKSSLLVLQRVPNVTNQMYRYADEYPNINVTRYYNPNEEEIPGNWPRAVYPLDITTNSSINGGVMFDPDFQSKCVNDGCGKFKIDYRPKIIIGALEILQSKLSYNYESLKWDRKCFTKNEIQSTYNHEAQHIFNAEYWINLHSDIYMSKRSFDNKELCEKELLFTIETNLYILWSMWKDKEAKHENPESPKYSGYKEGIHCEY